MNDLYRVIFSRNIGLLTESEQYKLRTSTVGIAGVGGVGGLLAERLIRLGIGHIKILDPGYFELSNLNRQFTSSTVNIGKSKVEVIHEQLKDINPESHIYFDKTGIVTDHHAKLFVQDCDLIIDEMDFGLFGSSILLQRAARKKGIFYMFASALGFGALVVLFDPNGLSLEEYNKLSPDTDLERISNLDIPIESILPIMPSYAKDIGDDAIEDMIRGKRQAPSTSIGAGLASIVATNEAMNIILEKRSIASAPEYTYIDLLDRVFITGKIDKL